MSKFIQFSVFLLGIALFFGCKKDDGPTLEDRIRLAIERNPTQHETDVEKIADYLFTNNITAQSTFSGMHYLIEQEGSGGNPGRNSTVTVFYKGYYLDGEVFDQTTTSPIVFPLSQLILGWQEGIPLLKKGGKCKLFLPSALAYGANPPQPIRANAVMIFEVELVNF